MRWCSSSGRRSISPDLPSDDLPDDVDALDALREVLSRVPAGAEFPDLDRARSLLADASAGNRAAPAQDG